MVAAEVPADQGFATIEAEETAAATAVVEARAKGIAVLIH
jgi:hypothetical protein